MQEGFDGFDIKTACSPLNIPARLLIFYCLGLWIATATVAIRLWIRLGFTSSRAMAALENASGMVATRDPSALVTADSSFPERQPEAGLRGWAGLSTTEPMESFLKVVRRADAEFRYRLSRMSIMLGSLRYGMIFATCFAIFVGWDETRRGLVGIQAQDFFGRTLLWVLQETGDLLGGTCIVVLTVFAVYWHFSQRLARRRSHWEYFVSRALGE